jgi:kynurenine formamidase
MHHHRHWLSLPLVVMAAIALQGFAQAPPDSGETPIGAPWWPSRWGADDERGAANLITPEKVVEASRSVTEGKVYQLGREYVQGMPLPGQRHYSLTIPGLPTGAPLGENGLVHNDELISGEIGQIGTQFDGLGHIGVHMGDEDVFYNGFKLSEFGNTYGLQQLGVENVGPIFTRGVLLDVAGIKGERSLPGGYVITVDDLQAALDVGGTELRPGDAALIRTGHGVWWLTDNAKYADSEPGIGLDAAKWLTEQEVVLVGSDNWAVEVVPHEDPNRPFEVHQWLLVRNGTYILENLDLEELAAAPVYEFTFVFSPLRLKGATGSPGNPIAVK